jgi:hypothetical protein
VNTGSYSLGQILYVVLRKEAQIYPMHVVKISVEKSLEGELTTYRVCGSDPSKVFDLHDVDGEIFESADEVRTVLIDRTTKAISQRIDQAVGKARQWYPTGHETRAKDPLDIIKKPAGPGQAPRGGSMVRREVAELGAELASEAEEASMVDVPDGNGGFMKAKVKSVKLPSTLS